MSCRCTGIMPATDADIPRARTVQSRHGHVSTAAAAYACVMLPVTGEDAEMRGGAERAQRRLSEVRVGWLCSAACRLGIGRSRGQSSARIWTAPGTSACVVRVSLPGQNDAAGTQARVGIAPVRDGRTQRHPLSAPVANPRSPACTPGPRSIVGVVRDGMNVLSGACEAATYT